MAMWKNIPPWPCGRIFLHVTKYSIPSVKKHSINVNRIFLKRFVGVHLLALMCSPLTLMGSQDSILAYFCRMDHQHPYPHGTFVPCMPYHVPLPSQQWTFLFYGISVVLRCSACFAIAFTQSSNISIVSLHACTHC
jgi:hypothetical protein